MDPAGPAQPAKATEPSALVTKDERRERTTYRGLRRAIRITGVLVMLLGLGYLATGLVHLWSGGIQADHPRDFAYILVVTLFALGLGYFVVRIGWAMLQAVTPGTVGSFAFIFGLVFTLVLLQVLPASAIAAEHPGVALLLPFLYFGTVFLTVRCILLFLLFPRSQRG